MTDRPIIFSAPMVRALLDGRKTQTRRLATSPLRRCEVGDRVWVRECHAEVGDGYLCVTRADYPDCVPPHFENVPPAGKVRWTPSIYMPRRLSRLTLIVEAVKAEPLQAIGSDDAIAEGIEPAMLGYWRNYIEERVPLRAPESSYESLWRTLHGPESWAANPDVVALTFRVVRGNVDRIAG